MCSGPGGRKGLGMGQEEVGIGDRRRGIPPISKHRKLLLGSKG